MERIFDEIDADDDGAVTKEEVAAAHEAARERYRQRIEEWRAAKEEGEEEEG
jgi:hypothetical protein